MSTSNSKHIQGKNVNHIKQVQQPTNDNHQTVTRNDIFFTGHHKNCLLLLVLQLQV